MKIRFPTFYNMIFTAQALRDFGIQKRDETERPERFRYENVGHLAELPEILPQILGRQIFGAPANENLARHLLYETLLKIPRRKPENDDDALVQSYLRIRHFHITPTTVNHVPLRQNSHLRFVRCESDKTEPFRLSGLRVFLNLPARTQTLAQGAFLAAQKHFFTNLRH